MDLVINRILDEIKNRVAVAVVTISGSGATVEIVQPGQATSKSFAAVIQNKTNTRVPRLDRPGNPPAIAYDALIEIDCYIAHNDQDPREYNHDCNRAMSEIVKVVTQNGAALWYSFNALAHKANWGSPRPLISELGAKEGITVPLVVSYRVSESDPTVAR